MKITMDYKQYQDLLEKVKALESRLNYSYTENSDYTERIYCYYFDNEDTKKEFELLKGQINDQRNKIHELQVHRYQLANSYKARRKYRKHGI